MNKVKMILGLALLSITGSVFAAWVFVSEDSFLKAESAIDSDVNDDWEFLPAPAPRALLQGETIRLIYDDLIYRVGDTFKGVTIDRVDSNFNRTHGDISSGSAFDSGFFSDEYIEKIVIDDSFADYEPTNMEAWFSFLPTVTEIEGIEKINTSNVTSMNGLFNYCYSLPSLNISSWDTSSLVTAVDLFNSCASLGNLNLSNWDVSKLTNARAMFYYCDGMNIIDLSSWDLSSAINIEYMLSSCDALTTVKLPTLSNSKIQTMRGILDGCKVLTNLEAGDWDISSVTNIDSVFRNCSSLTQIDLSSWDTSSVTSCESLFSGCTSLKTIYANPTLWNMNNVTKSDGMFLSCNQLVGGNGTRFNSSYIDKQRAVVDGYNGRQGYLSSK